MTVDPGVDMFARYAHAPNALGYCGPPLGATLQDGSDDEVRKAATRFSGAWPYLKVLARLTGIADPLDYRLVESYWLGGGVGAEIDAHDFYAALLEIIGPQAGHYWSHLTPDLADEAAGNHCFHVFGVYPWTRLLGRGVDEHPLGVLDNCRITPGEVVSVDGDRVEMLCRGLVFDGCSLTLGEPSPRSLDVWTDGYSAVPDAAPGDLVAVHWDRLCGRLSGEQVAVLEVSTDRQLRVTSERLGRAG